MGTTPVPHTWPALLTQLIAREDLSADDTAWAMDQIMSGAASQAQIAGFAVALRAKGETPEEISGMADAMLAHARRIELRAPAVDIVGTGGDRSNSVNISTMATIVTAAAGAPVAKHGNRSASSKAGAADVLETLGIAIDLQPETVHRGLEEIGIGFCFAPAFHPAFRHTGPPRRELGVPTTFNLLGPLTNPAQPRSALIGCAYADKTRVLAEVFAQRGMSVLVARGDDGLDEITTTTTTSVWVVSGGTVSERTFDPAALGIPRATAEDLRGGDATANAEVVRELVSGKTGPVRDAVVLNAAAALAAFTGFSGSLEDDLAAGLDRANRAIDTGAAATLLDRWIAFSGDAR
ncbi:anthranilate phosphoribosyltransferase [Amycolatopsis sp. FDAARGOS 1241]|uniref:anthranilate phosphoribosyltransferase n=1 Tax=Amycolatopsis sp. FDAARGOS 1241 TaxID=2778070 RepID=UPI001951E86E|nr:anthranilate phosphoribosyltransferase [Amycolatopsis sp. FDAARGOS 1241]QRP44212.1 anthranilate phosphoribosyltransferase [Amycolatopsis sp. FDAARGOS 1241]